MNLEGGWSKLTINNIYHFVQVNTPDGRYLCNRGSCIEGTLYMSLDWLKDQGFYICVECEDKYRKVMNEL